MPVRDNPPAASALIESLRGVGYSLETAVADLVDNSIAAEALCVDIAFQWRDGEDPLVSIADDGCGLGEDELIAAMRFGGFGPDKPRHASDLGRFGLGLKTASLSQCRRLSVASKRDDRVAVFCWDLDHIKHAGGGWELLEGAPDALRGALLDPLASRTRGTVVVWDRIDFGRASDRPTLEAFNNDLARVERHLAMVFHRFLGGDGRRLQLTINNRRIRAWDPFLESQEATIPRPEQPLRGPGGVVRVRAFILPHRDRFANATQFEAAGGPEGWNAQQGFYVYREKRLLSPGGWLGLGGSRAWTREESGRLARIRVDIPNSADLDWRIDIRKAIARPPDALKRDLARIAEDARRIARDVFVRRGGRATGDAIDPIARVWQVNPSTSSRRYTVNREHQLVFQVAAALGTEAALLDALLRSIEITVPVERVWLDIVEKGEPVLGDSAPTGDGELERMAAGIVRTLVAAGKSHTDAVEQVCLTEPFDRMPGLRGRLKAP